MKNTDLTPEEQGKSPNPDRPEPIDETFSWHTDAELDALLIQMKSVLSEFTPNQQLCATGAIMFRTLVDKYGSAKIARDIICNMANTALELWIEEGGDYDRSSVRQN